jgi:uncharacterized protein (TIGR03067 family)
MKKILFSVAALLLALTLSDGAGAQQKQKPSQTPVPSKAPGGKKTPPQAEDGKEGESGNAEPKAQGGTKAKSQAEDLEGAENGDADPKAQGGAKTPPQAEDEEDDGGAALDARGGARAELRGAAFIINGKALPRARAQALRLRTNKRRFALQLGDRTLLRGLFKLDPGRSPKRIDMLLTSGQAKGRTVKGILDVNGDTLRICYALPGRPRPTTFSSRPGSGNRLLVLRRVQTEARPVGNPNRSLRNGR